MSTLTLTVLLQLSVAASGSHEYTEACRLTKATGQPLVVMVGADWCPACRQMSQTVLPEVKRSGALDNVVFTYVNTDEQGSLASKLTRGGNIPQLIVFCKTETGWKRQGFVGARSADEVKSFIARVSESAEDSEEPIAELSSR